MCSLQLRLGGFASARRACLLLLSPPQPALPPLQHAASPSRLIPRLEPPLLPAAGAGVAPGRRRSVQRPLAAWPVWRVPAAPYRCVAVGQEGLNHTQRHANGWTGSARGACVCQLFAASRHGQLSRSASAAAATRPPASHSSIPLLCPPAPAAGGPAGGKSGYGEAADYARQYQAMMSYMQVGGELFVALETAVESVARETAVERGAGLGSTRRWCLTCRWVSNNIRFVLSERFGRGELLTLPSPSPARPWHDGLPLSAAPLHAVFVLLWAHTLGPYCCSTLPVCPHSCRALA